MMNGKQRIDAKYGPNCFRANIKSLNRRAERNGKRKENLKTDLFKTYFFNFKKQHGEKTRNKSATTENFSVNRPFRNKLTLIESQGWPILNGRSPTRKWKTNNGTNITKKKQKPRIKKKSCEILFRLKMKMNGLEYFKEGMMGVENTRGRKKPISGIMKTEEKRRIILRLRKHF